MRHGLIARTNRKEFELENRKCAPYTKESQVQSGVGRIKLLAFCIRHIPTQYSWRTEAAIVANKCLLNPIFTPVNNGFDEKAFKTALKTVESDADMGLEAYGNLLSILRADTGLDLMGDLIVKRHGAVHVQRSLTRAFGILALAWAMSVNPEIVSTSMSGSNQVSSQAGAEK